MQGINKTPSIFRQALSVNKKPFPWLKAFLAGVAAGLPIVIFGILTGKFEYGLIAGLGGFTYLYVFPIPYAQLAKKLTWVVLSITACVFFGTLLAPYPTATAIMMGLIGATAIFIFGAFRLIGPSAIFFVLVFAMTTGMPIAPEEAFIRAGLAFLGGLISFIIAMGGWLINPYGQEKTIIKRTYFVLADYLDSIGTDKENDQQHLAMSTLKEARQILSSGYNPWGKTDLFNHLYVLNNYANKIFLYIVEEFQGSKLKLPKEIGESLRIIAKLIDSKSIENTAEVQLVHPEEMDEKVAVLLIEIMEAKKSLTISSASLNEQVKVYTPSATNIILGAFDKNSIIFINALRFGAITTLAAIFAFEFEFQRSFWIPLSCVAVMAGSTAVATFHRAIQRSFGTIFGILIASIILSLNPSGIVVAIFVFLLTFMTELFIVKNYGLAALFFTPNALIMAESGNPGQHSFEFFASARLIDVAIGIAIGLVGVWLIGRKTASSRLPHQIAKTIRSQAQCFYTLFSNQTIDGKNIELNKMETNITNLKMVYDTATGEIPKDKKALEYFWPIIFKLEELGYLLNQCSKIKERTVLDDQKLAQYLLVFENLSSAVERKMSIEEKCIPEIPGFQSVYEVIVELQKYIKKDKTS
ncbi:putative membrane protein YccC OS=Ureibacillus acetophenoni OX=614649 GN=SAMN05877842_10280 PE=4 SV=1 [Ureibacillus acetophenoni]